MSNKYAVVSTKLFEGKTIPDFIKNHTIFKTPTEIDKIFPHLGIHNFKDKVNIDRPVLDVRKEGAFITNLLRVMTDAIVKSKENINTKVEYLQFAPREERLNARDKINDMGHYLDILGKLAQQFNPDSNDVITKAIGVDNGKVSLKLFEDITDANGKVFFKKGSGLFRVFNKVKEKMDSFGVEFINLDQTNEFKTFSKENLTNKEYNVVFSSVGPEGAWDIATMSMRGIKSCQRWDGEYPRCLVGSISSKFVGIMYLTSGVDFENKGPKMLKRCVVRYVIDADSQSPCILIDKMYPEFDKDVVNLFVSSLKSRTKLDVYYTSHLENKTRHLYIPKEKIANKIEKAEVSYQDTAIKSERDYRVHIVTNKAEDISREINAFRYNLSLFLSRKFDEVNEVSRINNRVISGGELMIIRNIKNTSPNVFNFCEAMSNLLVKYFKEPSKINVMNVKNYMRDYIRSFVLSSKTLKDSIKAETNQLLRVNTSKPYDIDLFIGLLFAIFTDYAKQEMRKLV